MTGCELRRTSGFFKAARESPLICLHGIGALRCRGVEIHRKSARICVLPRIGQINDAVVVGIHSVTIFHRPREVRNWRRGIQVATGLKDFDAMGIGRSSIRT